MSLFFLFFLGFLLVFLAAFYAYSRFSKNWTFAFFLRDLKRKLWMTFALGIVFFSLYLVFVYSFSLFLEFSHFDLFHLVYKRAVDFVYGALFLFAFFSLSIYFVRMIVKYIFLMRGKDH